MSTTSPTRAAARTRAGGGRGAVLLVVCAAQFMVVLDATVVNVMAPQIRAEIPAALTTLQWVTSAYVLVFGGFMLLGGRLTDVVGRRRVFGAGVVLFTAASLLAGLAGDIGLLIAARAAQGLGAALLSPAALSILVTTFTEPAARAKALGVWGTVMGVAASCGTLLGGLIVEAGWRLAFLINVPVGVLLTVGVAVALPRAAGPAVAGRLDVRGALLGTVGLIALVFGLTSIPEHGWVDLRSLGAIVAGVALLGVFLLVERSAAVPMLPLELFRSRATVSGALTVLAAAGVMLPFFFLLPQYMQSVLGYTPLQTGLAYLPTTVAMLVVSGLVPMLAARIGHRLPYVVGGLLTVVAALLLTQTGENDGYWSILFPVTALMGVGLVVCMMISPVVGTADADESDAGAVSAVLNSASEIGGAIGLAVAVTAVSAQLGGAEPTSGAALNDALHAGAWVLVAWAVLNVVVGGLVIRSRRAGGPATPAAVPAATPGDEPPVEATPA